MTSLSLLSNYLPVSLINAFTLIGAAAAAYYAMGIAHNFITHTAIGRALWWGASDVADAWMFRTYYGKAIGGRLRRRYYETGKWAVVTGATDGIGKELAVNLAVHHGLSVVLVSRTRAKLSAVQSEIQAAIAKSGVDRTAEVAVFALDFSTADDAAYTSLFAFLDSMEICMMVNNVGLGIDTHTVDTAPVDVQLSVIKVNTEPQLRLTRYAVGRFKSAHARIAAAKNTDIIATRPALLRCGMSLGAIVNLSSLSSLNPIPFRTVYGATKAFNRVHSDGVAIELMAHAVDTGLGIDVHCVVPAYVDTNINRYSPRHWMFVGVTKMVNHCVAKIGRGEYSACLALPAPAGSPKGTGLASRVVYSGLATIRRVANFCLFAVPLRRQACEHNGTVITKAPTGGLGAVGRSLAATLSFWVFQVAVNPLRNGFEWRSCGHRNFGGHDQHEWMIFFNGCILPSRAAELEMLRRMRSYIGKDKAPQKP